MAMVTRNSIENKLLTIELDNIVIFLQIVRKNKLNLVKFLEQAQAP